jgi:hypothetical protein
VDWARRFPAFDLLFSKLPSLKLPSLKYAYTLVAVSLLVVLVVVPGLGFFKVAHDYVHRLFLQSQQLNLASRLAERKKVIENYYAHLNADPSFKLMRLAEPLDRYDKVFLNCPAANLDKSQASELHASFPERAILYLTDRFPADPLGARLQGLGRSETDPPDFKWKVSEQTVNCGAGTLTGGSLFLMGPGDPIVSPIPTWQPRMRMLWLGVVLLGLGLWIYYVAGRLFLLDMETLPPLENWQPGESSHLYRYMLLLGHPKSGKQLAVRKLACVQLVDFAEMATTGRWEIPAPISDQVALYHFEFGIDNADINMNKLRILEHLMHVQHQRIILLSTVDPLYYLTAGSPDIVVSGEKKDPTIAAQLLDRWAAVLSPFRKVMIKDITVARFCKRVNDMRRRRPEPEFNAFIDQVVEECDHTAQLRKIGVAILGGNLETSGLPRPRLIGELLDRADSYYRVLWSTCTQDERLVLYQLAKDGWANPKNELAIQNLHRRGLIVLPGSWDDPVPPGQDRPQECRSQATQQLTGLRIMSESFRQFIRDSQQREEIAAWQQEGEQSPWRFLKLSLGILGVAIAAWLLYSQQQFFNTVVAYVGAIGAAVGVVFKLLSDLRGRRSAPSAGTD